MTSGFDAERLRVGSLPMRTEGFALLLLERGELRAHGHPGETLWLAEGDVLVLGPGVAVALSCRRAPAVLVRFRAQGEWLAGALAVAGFAGDAAPPRAAAVRAGSEAARRAALRLRGLAQPAEGPARAGSLLRAAHALELLGIAVASVRESAGAPRRRRRSPRREALAEALEQLVQAPLHGVALASFAAELGYSERHASRLVRERLGVSFGEYLTDLRVARARRLLAESDCSVIAVAEEAGFGSLGQFNHVFRVRTGETPSRYRARSQAGEPGGAAAPPLRRTPWREQPASSRSSRFTSESSQAARGTPPS